MNEIEAQTISEKKPMTAFEQQDSGTYIGLLLGGIILATGSVVLFNDISSAFSSKGIDITPGMMFRTGLMLASAYGAISCFSALYRIAYLNRMFSKKIGEEFEDFVIYTRPFVEEVIRQRLAVEKLVGRLDTLERRDFEKREAVQGKESHTSSKWWEFLLFVALLTNISTGLYVYLEAHPYEMVPYSVIILGLAWWVLLAKYFGLLFDPRGIYIPAFFIAFLPTVSIVLNIIIAPYQALFIVFLILFLYVVITYYYYKYLTTGILPFSVAKLREEIEASKRARAEKSGSPEIEMEKRSILERALQEIDKNEPPPHVPEEYYRSPDIRLRDIVSNAIRASIRGIRPGFNNALWPDVLSGNGRKISISGFIIASAGTASAVIFPDKYTDVSFVASLFGTVMVLAGYSIAGERGKRLFSPVSLLLLSGLVLSSAAILSVYSVPAESVEKSIFIAASLYLTGLFLILLNIIVNRRSRRH